MLFYPWIKDFALKGQEAGDKVEEFLTTCEYPMQVNILFRRVKAHAEKKGKIYEPVASDYSTYSYKGFQDTLLDLQEVIQAACTLPEQPKPGLNDLGQLNYGIDFDWSNL